jgi:hypothetical protein
VTRVQFLGSATAVVSSVENRRRRGWLAIMFVFVKVLKFATQQFASTRALVLKENFNLLVLRGLAERNE